VRGRRAGVRIARVHRRKGPILTRACVESRVLGPVWWCECLIADSYSLFNRQQPQYSHDWLVNCRLSWRQTVKEIVLRFFYAQGQIFRFPTTSESYRLMSCCWEIVLLLHATTIYCARFTARRYAKRGIATTTCPTPSVCPSVWPTALLDKGLASVI